MIARIINIAEVRARVIGGAEVYSPAQKSMLRRAGMIATSSSWFRYWLPIRWMMYPFISLGWLREDQVR